MINSYINKIWKTTKVGDASEESYYPDLKSLFESFILSKGQSPNITVVPKRTSVGIPDFTIRRDKELIGYIEAKDPKYEDLSSLPKRDTEQIARYKDNLPNLILTNFIDFWLWRKEEKRWIKQVRLFEPELLHTLKEAPSTEKHQQLQDLIESFFNFNIPERKTAKSLAEDLAGRTQLLRPYIVELLTDNKEEEIDRIYGSFKEFLIPDLSEEDFADIYAQTIAYGLFTARILAKTGKGFNRYIAQSLLPKNLPLLYHTFNLLSSSAIPEAIEWLVTDISTILAYADIEKIIEELNIRKGEEDPFVHFYEDFLAEYDPKRREQRGVYYTPFPAVSYITESINEILKTKDGFKFKEGFSDKNVTSLDFASGTLTFPVNAIKIALREYAKWNPDLGGISGFTRNHILKHFYAFELLMAPYVLGHLKISLLLQEYGYKQNSQSKDERFNLYLTNTLDFDPVKHSEQPFTFILSQEGNEALEVKKDKQILVIMGNPPYSVSSQNDTQFTKKEMNLYKKDVADERNIQLLSDDYVKFIRFAHWKIEQVGSGIIGVITKNTYLSVSAFKGMRKQLLEYFDEIYVLDLHGKLYEKTADGTADENIFDIRVGVSIMFLVKNNKKTSKYASLYYSESRGSRLDKNNYLSTNTITTTEWESLEIDEEYFFFEKKEFNDQELYRSFTKLTDIFNKKTSGIKSGRDNFISDISKETLYERINEFITSDLDPSGLKNKFSISDTSNLTVQKMKNIFNNIDPSLFHKFYFKPFNSRVIYFDRRLIDRDRYSIMKDFLVDNNLGLAIKKRFNATKYSHYFVVDGLCDINLLQGQTYIFPLYYNEVNGNSQSQQNLFSEDVDAPNSNSIANNSNIKSEFHNKLNKAFGKNLSPESIFYYIYAILNSSTYADKYPNQIANDFPNIPITSEYRIFENLSKIGEDLVSLQLLKDKTLENPTARFFGKGSEIIESKAKFRDGKIFINESQYFAEVEKEVWEFQVGGYQIFDKWFKDRIGRQLSGEDVRHVCKVITSIKKIISIRKEVDNIYPVVESSLQQ